MIHEKPLRPEQDDKTLREDVQTVVLVGMKILYSERVLPMFREGLEAKAPWPIKLASQVAGLMKMVDDKSPQGIPAHAIPMAAKLLLMDMVEFIVQIGGPKLSEKTIKQALPILKKMLIAIFKQGKGAQAAQKGQQPQQGQPQEQMPQQDQQQMPQQQGLIAQGV